MRSSDTRPRGGEGETPLARLSRPPERSWPDGALHHGSRAFLLVLLAVCVTIFLPPSQGLRVAGYEVGVVADEDIIASLSFGVPKNEEDLERERTSAAAAVPPTFRYDPDAVNWMEEALDDFMEAVTAAAAEEPPDQAISQTLSDLGLVISPAQSELLRNPETRAVLETAALRSVRELLPVGVLDEAARLEPGTASQILVVDPDQEERFVSVGSLLTTREFYQQTAQFLPANAGSELNELLRLILIRFMTPSLRFDAVATEADRDSARRAVPTIRATVLQGEAIVRANQQIGDTELERLLAYEEALRAQGRLEDQGFNVAGFAASIVLNLLILGIFGILVYLFRPDVYGNFRWLLLLGVLIIAFMSSAGIIARNQLPAELLPIAFVALATAVLWDGRLAMVLAVTLAVLAGAQAPFHSVHAWLPAFVAGSAAALSVRAVRRRSQTWIFIAIIAGAYVTVLSVLGVVFERDLSRVVTGFAWAGGNAVVSAILAMGFLPVFEWFTRITTDQTLLEWADPNRPLLKRLSMEAPGTYAHTINVANLSEAAANAIGANGLLCRVGVYYHDVGKMLKPQFFIENQPGGVNPHDKLKPATSASIVRDHVTEGIRLAEEAKLPDVLVDFIPEHHGTQEISFFFEKARAESLEAEELDAEEYRYPGPRPQSRETAIVMLADSVESATRTLQEPTPDRVRDLIDTLFENKIRNHQLDDAPLTLREIGIIKSQFQKVLAGVYHQRVDYPETRHLTEAAGGRADDRAGGVNPAGSDSTPPPSTPIGEDGPPRRRASDRVDQPALFPVDGDDSSGSPEGRGDR